MRTLFAEGFWRDAILFLLVATLAGGLITYGLSHGVEWYFRQAISGVAGAPGEFDVIVHLREESAEQSMPILKDRLEEAFPGYRLQRAPDLVGYANVLIALPQAERGREQLTALGALFESIPGYDGFSPIVGPSVVVSEVHPAVRDDLLTVAEALPDVDFAFVHGDGVWAVARAPDKVDAVAAALHEWVGAYRVLEAIPSDTSAGSRLPAYEEAIAGRLSQRYPSLRVVPVDRSGRRAEGGVGAAGLAQMEQLQESFSRMAAALQRMAPGGETAELTSRPASLWRLLARWAGELLQRLGLEALGQRLTQWAAGPVAGGAALHEVDELLRLVADLQERLGAAEPATHLGFLVAGREPLPREQLTPEELAGIAADIAGDVDLRWVVRTVGVVQPDARTTLMLLVAEARRVVALMTAVMLTAFLFLVDLSTLVTFGARLEEADGRGRRTIRWKAALWSGAWGVLLTVGMVAIGGGSGGGVPLGWVAALGLLVGVGISFFAKRLSPVDEEEFQGALSLGLPETGIWREVVVPAGRPGLFYWLNRVARGSDRAAAGG